MRTKTDYIVIHCAATPAKMDIGAKEISEWHKARGFSEIGYHFVIRRDGSRETGRNINAVGAHVVGYNHKSVGICLVGGMDRDNKKPENNFTKEQFATLNLTLKELHDEFPRAVIVGHRDLDAGKACPSFSVSEYMDNLPELAPEV
jgi:N-acetyl-anhydromuramyl-L-alanine amidase AmpD